MRLKITKTNLNTNYYIIKDFKINGKRTTKIIEKLGTENDINNQDSVGALVRYYYFNLEVKKAVADIKLITTNQNGNTGYIWVEYSTKYYDLNETLIYGAEKVISRWDIEKENDVSLLLI